MKASIFRQLFVVILITAVFIVVSMAIAVNWSFQRGFSQYLQQVEMEKLDELTDYLRQRYQTEGNWQFIRDLAPRQRRRLWRTWLQQAFKLPPPPQHHNTSPSEQHRPPPPLLGLLRRLRLLDAQQQHLLGRRFAMPEEYLLPITIEQQTIGWLAVARNPILSDQLAQRFLEQQANTYALIAVLILLLSMLVAAVLARQFVIPVQRLTCAARELAAGRYQTRLEVQRSDELGQLAQDVNQLAHTLECNEHARQQWIADISHELRTPLAILQGEIEAMQDGIRPANANTLQSLHQEVLALNKLVNDLYELSLSDLGALNYRKQTVNVVSILADTVALFDSRSAAHRLDLQCPACNDDPIMVFADAQRLTQLFTNLLENSLRYTEVGGFVRLELGIEAQQVVIDIQDTPPAVPAQALAHLFERLYRVEQSRNRDLGGAGLGLAICQNIVVAHEGHISAQSSIYGGLWIQIRLPISKSA